MKKLLLILLGVYLTTCARFMPLDDDPLVRPDSYHIIQLEDELFMVHNAIDDAGASEYRVYNFQGTIALAGLYQLAGDLSQNIVIATDNVTLDLAGHKITSLSPIVASNRSNITIENGNIEGTNAAGPAVSIASCTQVNLRNLSIESPSITTSANINLDTVSIGSISNCIVGEANTGISLDTCNNIMIQDCVARANTTAGYALITSTTCMLINCQAVSTGEGQTALNTDIFGFRSTDGSGNIFERCIANATQGLTVTGFGSVVAGFGLLGSESCSKIVGCTASNTQTDPDGVTIGYGIYLEPQIDSGLTLLDSDLPGGFSSRDMAFSPDGKYIGLADFGNDITSIYSVSYPDGELTFLVDADDNQGAWGFDWHPAGEIVVSKCFPTGLLPARIFDPTNNTLTQLNVFNTGNSGVRAFKFAPNGKIAYVQGTGPGGGAGASALSFDAVTGEFAFIASVSPGIFANYLDVRSDGNFFTLASIFSADDALRIYYFDGVSITNVATTDDDASNHNAVRWNPNGRFIVRNTGATIKLYDFLLAGSLYSVTLVNSVVSGGSGKYFAWSPDGRYLAASGTPLQVFAFDAGTYELTLVAQNATGTTYLEWSPDGSYIAGGSNGLRIYQALTFPQKNVIKDNLVFCNSGGALSTGIGISGSSIQNVIVGNTCYKNPINPMSAFMNYAYVQNKFNYFGNGPTAMQNVDIVQAICTPFDLDLIAKQIEDKLCDIQTKIDSLI